MFATYYLLEIVSELIMQAMLYWSGVELWTSIYGSSKGVAVFVSSRILDSLG